MAPHTRPDDQKTQSREEYAIVLDIILSGKQSFKDTEIAQAVGVNSYTLLELVPKQGITLKTNQWVYIGDGKREEVQYIKRAIPSHKLSPSAKSELLFALIEIVNYRESEFVDFFNRAGPITIRKHSLELVSGVGKKHLSELLAERDSKPFESFEDIRNRCSFLHEPEKAIAQRIEKEIEGKDDFKFFIKRQ